MSKFLRHIIRDRVALIGIATHSILLLGCAQAEDASASQNGPASLEFDSSFLNVDAETSVDLSRFAVGASALQGIYKTALYVNDQPIINTDIEFKPRADKSVYPCLTSDIIKNIAFNYEKLPADFLSRQADSEMCLDFSKNCQKRRSTSTAMKNVLISSFPRFTC